MAICVVPITKLRIVLYGFLSQPNSFSCSDIGMIVFSLSAVIVDSEYDQILFIIGHDTKM
jgi:hypothetical protein